MSQYKLVVVGDGAVGKTCLLVTYVRNEFPENYVPTIFDNYPKEMSAGGQVHTVNLWDTAGQEDFDRLRPLSYSDANVIVLCYAINSPASYENVNLKWIPELHKYLPNIPIVLVATKLDLRSDPETLQNLQARNLQPIGYEQGRQLRRKIRAHKFFECSALTRENITTVFEEALDCVINPRAYKDDGCCPII